MSKEYLYSREFAQAKLKVTDVFPIPPYNPDRNAREVRAILPPLTEFSVQREGDVYSFSTTEPIAARNVHDLFRSLTNTYSRPHEEQRWINDSVRRKIFGDEALKIAMLFSEKRYMQYVVNLAGRLQTLEGAWSLFAADRRVSKSFLDSDKDYVTAELARGVADSMKDHPEMWDKNKARFRNGRMMVSDFAALREFNRLRNLDSRSLIYEEQVDRKSAEEDIFEDDVKDEILIKLYDATSLPNPHDRLGYLLHKGSNEDIVDVDGELMVVRGGRKTRIYFSPSGTPAFIIYARHNGSISPVLRWQNKDGVRKLLDPGDTNVSAVSERRFSNNVSIVQELGSERASVLLGVVIMLGGSDYYKRLVRSKKIVTTDNLLAFIQQNGDKILDSKVFEKLEESVA